MTRRAEKAMLQIWSQSLCSVDQRGVKHRTHAPQPGRLIAPLTCNVAVSHRSTHAPRLKQEVLTIAGYIHRIGQRSVRVSKVAIESAD